MRHTSLTTNIQRILALNVKKRRKRLGYTQMQLAEQCGISTSFVGEIELCKKFPSAATLQKLIEALNMSPAELFSDEYNLIPNSGTYFQDLHYLTVFRLKEEIEKIFDTMLQYGSEGRSSDIESKKS